MLHVFWESTSRSQQRSWHFKALNIAFHPFHQKPLSVFLLHSQLPSPWSCVTVPLASDSWVSKSLLSFSLDSSCSLKFCSSERALLPSTSLWLCFTCSQGWTKTRDITKNKKVATHFTLFHHIHTHTHTWFWHWRCISHRAVLIMLICSSACCSCRPVSGLCISTVLCRRAAFCCSISWQDKPKNLASRPDILNTTFMINSLHVNGPETHQWQWTAINWRNKVRYEWLVVNFLRCRRLSGCRENVLKPVFDWTMAWKPCWHYLSASLMPQTTQKGRICMWDKASFSQHYDKWLVRKKWKMSSVALIHRENVIPHQSPVIVNIRWSECYKQTAGDVNVSQVHAWPQKVN